MSRISYRNFNILKHLKDKNFDAVKFLEIDRGLLENNYAALAHAFNANSNLFLQKVTYLTKPFVAACYKADMAYNLDAVSGFFEDEKDTTGVLLSCDRSILYNIGLTSEKKIKYCFIAFDAFGIFESYSVRHEGYGEEIISDFLRNWGDIAALIAEGDQAYSDNLLLTTVLNALVFKKYAKVEIVESKARSKIHVQGCKYLNETDLDIEYLDSNWFTTFVNSKSFKVGGHFRLQPKKKEGEWTKELIWIDDFEKKGYRRKATVLNKS